MFSVPCPHSDTAATATEQEQLRATGQHVPFHYRGSQTSISNDIQTYIRSGRPQRRALTFVLIAL